MGWFQVFLVTLEHLGTLETLAKRAARSAASIRKYANYWFFYSLWQIEEPMHNCSCLNMVPFLLLHEAWHFFILQHNIDVLCHQAVLNVKLHNHTCLRRLRIEVESVKLQIHVMKFFHDMNFIFNSAWIFLPNINVGINFWMRKFMLTWKKNIQKIHDVADVHSQYHAEEAKSILFKHDP